MQKADASLCSLEEDLQVTVDTLNNEKQSTRSSSPRSLFFIKPTVEENQEKGKSVAQLTDEDFYDYPKKEDRPSM